MILFYVTVLIPLPQRPPQLRLLAPLPLAQQQQLPLVLVQLATLSVNTVLEMPHLIVNIGPLTRFVSLLTLLVHVTFVLVVMSIARLLSVTHLIVNIGTLHRLVLEMTQFSVIVLPLPPLLQLQLHQLKLQLEP